MDVFLDELQLASVGMQYIEYSSDERMLLMTDARTFWREYLKDYGWNGQ